MIVGHFEDKIQYQETAAKKLSPTIVVKTPYKRLYGQEDRHLGGQVVESFWMIFLYVIVEYRLRYR